MGQANNNSCISYRDSKQCFKVQLIEQHD